MALIIGAIYLLCRHFFIARNNLAKRSAGINEKLSNIFVRMCSLSNRIC